MQAAAKTVSGSAIASVGAYAPLLRLDRDAAAKALKFSGLEGRGGGRRAVAGWDEDPLTLAVEAARIVSEAPSTVVFASTSAPFYERLHAALVVDALALPAETRARDVSGSRRCAVSALLDALLAPGSALVAAGERRPGRAGSPLHLLQGDGGAAAMVAEDGAARLIGWASLSHDLVDIYASREHPEPYAYEERFVRETAVFDDFRADHPQGARDGGTSPSDIHHAAVHEPLAGLLARDRPRDRDHHPEPCVRRGGGARRSRRRSWPLRVCARSRAGHTGRTHSAGRVRSGCDALVLEMTAPMPGAGSAEEALRQGLAFGDYVRFLSLNGALELDWGVRSEFEQKAQATVIARYGRDMIGFVGGRDAAGNVQFPKSRIPVRPDADGPESMQDVRLADDLARIVSVTADRLNFTPDPPFWFGLAQFDNGARVMMEFTDDDLRGFSVGDWVRMRLRVKSRDQRRGFRTYFWKAAPAERPLLEG